MTETNLILIIGTIYRIVGMLVGLVIIYFGYRLFLRRVRTPADAGSMQGSVGQLTLTLKRAAPGTFFVVLGAGVILMSIVKGVKVSEKRPVDRTVTLHARPESGLTGGESSAPPNRPLASTADSAAVTQEGGKTTSPDSSELIIEMERPAPATKALPAPATKALPVKPPVRALTERVKRP